MSAGVYGRETDSELSGGIGEEDRELCDGRRRRKVELRGVGVRRQWRVGRRWPHLRVAQLEE